MKEFFGRGGGWRSNCESWQCSGRYCGAPRQQQLLLLLPVEMGSTPSLFLASNCNRIWRGMNMLLLSFCYSSIANHISPGPGLLFPPTMLQLLSRALPLLCWSCNRCTKWSWGLIKNRIINSTTCCGIESVKQFVKYFSWVLRSCNVGWEQKVEIRL